MCKKIAYDIRFTHQTDKQPKNVSDILQNKGNYTVMFSWGKAASLTQL